MKSFILDIYQKPQTVFSLPELSLFYPLIPYNNLKRKADYFVKTGKLQRLRRGIYAKENYNPFELANKVYVPSYLSLETVLQREGLIFQEYKTIFAVSYLTRRVKVGQIEISYHQLKEEILLNKEGIKEEDCYSIAIKERAFLDTLFLYKNYYFDNLKPLDWEKVYQLLIIYSSQNLKKRVNEYYQIYKDEAVQ